MRRLTATQEIEAATLYKSGETLSQIAVPFGVSLTTIWRSLRRRGVVMRSPREAGTKLPLRHDAFDVLTPDAAYWCGFFFADGTIRSRPGCSAVIAVLLAGRDRGHLEKFRDFLGSTHAITAIPATPENRYRAAGAVIYSVNSDPLANRLRALGRYGGPLDAELAQSVDFWRGVVDGDGYIGISGGFPQFKLVGSRWLLDAFVEFLYQPGRLVPTKPRGVVSVRPSKSIYVVGTTGVGAAWIIELLYRDATTGLDRKLEAAADVLAQRKVRD